MGPHPILQHFVGIMSTAVWGRPCECCAINFFVAYSNILQLWSMESNDM